MRLALQHKYAIGLLCLFYVCIDCERRHAVPEQEDEGTELTVFKQYNPTEEKLVDIAIKEIQDKYKDITDFAHAYSESNLKRDASSDFSKIQTALRGGKSIRIQDELDDGLKQKERNIHSGLTELRNHNLLKYEGVAWTLERVSRNWARQQGLLHSRKLGDASKPHIRSVYTVASTHEVTRNLHQHIPDSHIFVVRKYNVKEGILIESNKVMVNKDSKWEIKKIIRIPGSIEGVRIELEQIDDFQHSSDDCLEALKDFASDGFAARSDVGTNGIYVQGTKFAACQQDIYWTYVVKGHNKQLADAQTAQLEVGGIGKDEEWALYLVLTETSGVKTKHCVRKYQAPTLARKLLNF